MSEKKGKETKKNTEEKYEIGRKMRNFQSVTKPLLEEDYTMDI